MPNFFGSRQCCCNPCKDISPNVCEESEVDIYESEWGDGTVSDNVQDIDCSSSVLGNYSISSLWEKDETKGVSSPSMKFESTASITTSGVNGSIAVLDYVLLSDAVFDPLSIGPFSAEICFNSYGKIDFIGENGERTSQGSRVCIVALKGSDLTVISTVTVDRMCWGGFSTTVTFRDPICPTQEPIQFGLGVMTECEINSAQDSLSKSNHSVAWFDNFSIKITPLNWSCYPASVSGDGSQEFAVTISGSSTVFDGATCSLYHGDTDGSFVCTKHIEGFSRCRFHYPESHINDMGISVLTYENWWVCSNGTGSATFVRHIAIEGVYTNATSNSISVQVEFGRNASGPGFTGVVFYYETEELQTCDTATLTLVNVISTSNMTGESSLGPVTSFDLGGVTGPTMTITMPTTITLDPA